MNAIQARLARFRIAHKLLLSSAVLALPIVVLLYSVESDYSTGIRTAGVELAGTRMLDPLRIVTGEVRRYERLSYLRLKGDLARETQRDDAEKKIDAALVEFTSAAAGTPLQSAAQVTAQWQQIKLHAPPDVTAHTAAFDQLTASVGTLVREVGDTTSLVLDSQLESFYLVEIAVSDLPAAQDTIGDTAMLAILVANEQKMSERDVLRFQVYGEALEGDTLTQLRHSSEIVLKQDRSTQGVGSSVQQNLPALLNRYQMEVAAGAAQIRRYSRGLDAGATPHQVAAQAERAEAAGADLWRVSVAELRGLIEQRLASLHGKRAAALFGGILAFALAWLVATLVARNITVPLEEVVRLARDIAGGRVKEARARLKSGAVREMLDFPTAVDEIYLLVGAIAHMTGSLDSLLAHVGSAGSQVAGSAAQITDAVRELEATVAEQAASTNQVTATSREIFQTVQELAGTVAEVSRVAQEAAQSAGTGVASLEKIHATMRSLAGAGEGLSAALATVSEKAHNVDEVTVAITKVANRTNLLSLNAAIEAEREGGSAGGFAVLAIEIRRLADQTAVAALDIEKLIQEMQGAVRDGVERVGQYAAEMRTSSAAVDSLSAGLERVIAHTRVLGPRFESVNEAMQTQSQGAGQIAESMTHLREAANHTRSSLAGFRQVSDQLRDAVDGLQEEVGRFSAAGG